MAVRAVEDVVKMAQADGSMWSRLVGAARARALGVYAQLVAVDEESAQARAEGGWRVDAHALALVVLVSALLSAQEYYGASSHYELILHAARWLGGEDLMRELRGAFAQGERARLWRLGYWVAATVVCYLVIPAAWVKLVLRARLSDYGFRLRGALDHAWIYVAIYSAILPVLIVASTTKSFQNTYPFYKGAGASWADLLAWESMYALQFMSLEFFFRGFMIQGLRARFGAATILVSVIPYCMIHFGKPFAETLGAIFAGLALGALALLTRSIWLGVAIHVSVAVTMDLLALWMKGEL